MNLRMVLPVEIAVIALLGAVYYGYHAVRDDAPSAKPAASSTASPTPTPLPTVKTTRLVNKQGKFAVGVPENVKAKKYGPAVTMESADKVMTMVISPVEKGEIAVSTKAFMRGMKKSYTDVKKTGTDAQTVDGHEATATYGLATNAKKAKIRFANVVVKASPRNYAINAFTLADADPLFVLPRVNAVVDTFEVVK